MGFGVKTPEQARAIGRGADGVVVGSALVDVIKATLGPDGRGSPQTAPGVLKLVASLAKGLAS